MIASAIHAMILHSFVMPGAAAIFAVDASTLAIERQPDGHGVSRGIAFVSRDGTTRREQSFRSGEQVVGTTDEGDAVLQTLHRLSTISAYGREGWVSLPSEYTATVRGRWCLFTAQGSATVYERAVLRGTISPLRSWDAFAVDRVSGRVGVLRKGPGGPAVEIHSPSGELLSSNPITSRFRGFRLEIVSDLPSMEWISEESIVATIGLLSESAFRLDLPVLTPEGISEDNESSNRGTFLCRINTSTGLATPIVQLRYASRGSREPQPATIEPLRNQIAVFDEETFAVLMGARVFVLREGRSESLQDVIVQRQVVGTN